MTRLLRVGCNSRKVALLSKLAANYGITETYFSPRSFDPTTAQLMPDSRQSASTIRHMYKLLLQGDKRTPSCSARAQEEHGVSSCVISQYFTQNAQVYIILAGKKPALAIYFQATRSNRPTCQDFSPDAPLSSPMRLRVCLQTCILTVA